jgi:hypothetical protein
LDLEQARTSHTLDRRGILGRHGKWDALSTTLGFLQKGSLLPPSLEEIWDYDVEDHRERIRVHMGLTKVASAILWELCTAELVELCLGLREQGGRLWSLVETYVDFGGASFFRLSYSAYGREEEEKRPPSWSRWCRAGTRSKKACSSSARLLGPDQSIFFFLNAFFPPLFVHIYFDRWGRVLMDPLWAGRD